MRSDLVDVTVRLHHETNRAVLGSTDGDREKAVWIPKSACEIEPGAGKATHTLTLPERVAIEKGLV
ncbi:hypothetical protein [Methylobacterium nodulans]|uniref:Uncharacterized protein n=1 Tax=Methylobacterium nodulans (strain LMG 21967 / CNCM I-2342 / ORS 2060) TaxID=460265 RepID=B8IIR7_METNO|nr:hypothetical protein [Methylobacterium nodulans]ACL59944.1 conserved hypothetical protein [Methylobacterium nodulans ORS 2060]